LMRRAIAAPVANEFRSDPQILGELRFIDGSERPATAEALLWALAERRPSFVLTTSHGATAPVAGLPLREALGLLAGQDRVLVRAESLLSVWEPYGAVWYAHACCSAGVSGSSRFVELVDEHLAAKLAAATSEGPLVAPLPQALLGARR